MSLYNELAFTNCYLVSWHCRGEFVGSSSSPEICPTAWQWPGKDSFREWSLVSWGWCLTLYTVGQGHSSGLGGGLSPPHCLHVVVFYSYLSLTWTSKRWSWYNAVKKLMLNLQTLFFQIFNDLFCRHVYMQLIWNIDMLHNVYISWFSVIINIL